jgi:transcriptional regulator with XRE-family HTH domain
MKKGNITTLFAEVGEQLQKNRISMGFSKEQVSEQTHISVETIEEIEKGELPTTPTIYLKDFVLRYSVFLGIRNSISVETFLNELDQNEKRIPKIKKDSEKRKPVKLILIVIIPLLLLIILLQVLLIVKITNKGDIEAIIQIGNDKISLKPNETLRFTDDFSGKIINTEKSLIVVEYYEDTWEVFFKEFEVLIKNGQDS